MVCDDPALFGAAGVKFNLGWPPLAEFHLHVDISGFISTPVCMKIASNDDRPHFFFFYFLLYYTASANKVLAYWRRSRRRLLFLPFDPDDPIAGGRIWTRC